MNRKTARENAFILLFEKAVRKWADIKVSKEYVKKLHYDLSRQEMTRKYVEVYKEF